MYLPIFFGVIWQTLGQSYDFLNTSEVNLQDMKNSTIPKKTHKKHECACFFTCSLLHCQDAMVSGQRRGLYWWDWWWELGQVVVLVVSGGHQNRFWKTCCVGFAVSVILQYHGVESLTWLYGGLNCVVGGNLVPNFPFQLTGLFCHSDQCSMESHRRLDFGQNSEPEIVLLPPQVATSKKFGEPIPKLPRN